MPATLTVPRLGAGSPGGLIAEWYVPEGASVQPGDPVFRLESGYVSIDVEAETEGVVRYLVPAGVPQFEGEAVGYVLANGERMPPVQRFDDEFDDPFQSTDENAGESADATPVAPPATGELAEDPEPEEEFTWSFDPEPADEPAYEPVAEFAPEEPHDPAPQPAEFDDRGSVVPLRRTQRWHEGTNGRPGLWELVTDEKEPVYQAMVSAPAAPQPLVIRVAVPMTEANKIRQQLATEWEAEGLTIRDEAIIVRAVGHALAGNPALAELAGSVLLQVLTPDGPEPYLAVNPGKGSFKGVVEGIQQQVPGDAMSSPVTVVSYCAFGIDSAEPRLPGGGAMALGLARPVVTTAATLTLAYDPGRVEDHDAAAFLGRVRELLVQPYALLAE